MKIPTPTKPRSRLTAAQLALRQINRTIGDRDLCAWLVAPGKCWIQTRNPRHARRLAQRKDTRLAAIGVAGGYLRTFAVDKGLSWASRLIERYQSSEMATGRGIKPRHLPVAASKSSAKINPSAIRPNTVTKPNDQ